MAKKQVAKKQVAKKRHVAKKGPVARKRREYATDGQATDPAVDPKALHDLLAVYYAALAKGFLQPHPPPLGKAGLTAMVYWQEYFANPDHLQPQDPDFVFVRGKIWS